MVTLPVKPGLHARVQVSLTPGRPGVPVQLEAGDDRSTLSGRGVGSGPQEGGMGVHCPPTKLQLPAAEQVALGVPWKPLAQVAWQLLPAGAPVQLEAQPVELPGTPSCAVMLAHKTGGGTGRHSPLWNCQLPLAVQTASGEPVKLALHCAGQVVPSSWPLQDSGKPVELPGTGTVLMLLHAALGTHCPVMLGRNWPLAAHTTVGAPVKLLLHTAVQFAPGGRLLQAADQPMVLLGRPGRVVVLHAAAEKAKQQQQKQKPINTQKHFSPWLSQPAWRSIAAASMLSCSVLMQHVC